MKTTHFQVHFTPRRNRDSSILTRYMRKIILWAFWKSPGNCFYLFPSLRKLRLKIGVFIKFKFQNNTTLTCTGQAVVTSLGLWSVSVIAKACIITIELVRNQISKKCTLGATPKMVKNRQNIFLLVKMPTLCPRQSKSNSLVGLSLDTSTLRKSSNNCLK